ncbi:MAG: hypothetical protein AAGD05_06315, partial [Bacteroidota bacterium]
GWRSCIKYGVRQGEQFWAGLKGGIPTLCQKLYLNPKKAPLNISGKSFIAEVKCFFFATIFSSLFDKDSPPVIQSAIHQFIF